MNGLDLSSGESPVVDPELIYRSGSELAGSGACEYICGIVAKGIGVVGGRESGFWRPQYAVKIELDFGGPGLRLVEHKSQMVPGARGWLVVAIDIGTNITTKGDLNSGAGVVVWENGETGGGRRVVGRVLNQGVPADSGIVAIDPCHDGHALGACKVDGGDAYVLVTSVCRGGSAIHPRRPGHAVRQRGCVALT